MTTYAQLQTDFPLWSKRTDLASMISGFVGLFEAKVNRKLRTRRQETSFTGTINASSKIALPSDWAAFKTLWQANYESAPCRVQSMESVVASDRTSGTPTMYAIDGTNVRFNGAGDMLGIYYATVPGLVANASNWLSTAAYDSYLFGVLSEASLYQMDEERALLYQARADTALQEIINTDHRDRFSGPIEARAR